MNVKGQVAAQATGQVSESHVAALDGVRGLAILLVLFFHTTVLASPILGSGPLDRGIWQAATAGWAGVDLFFVLSGYLITGILLDTRGRRGYFKSFYARRVLRIFPLYYAFLVVVLLLLPRLAPSAVHSIARLQGRQVWFWTYLTNIGMALHPGFTTLGHLWSLAVEEQFYLLWPTMVLLATPKTLLRLTVGMLLAAPVIRVGLLDLGFRPEVAFLLTPARMDSLAAGALVAILQRDTTRWAGLERHARSLLVWAGLALAAIIAVQGTLEEFDPIVQTAGFSLLAIWFGALVVVVLRAQPTTWFRKVLSWSPLRYIGLRSYGLYVIHPIMLVAVTRSGLIRRLPALAGSGLLPQMGYWALCLGASVVAAEVSWRVLEQPCLSLKRYFPYPKGPATVR